MQDPYERGAVADVTGTRHDEEFLNRDPNDLLSLRNVGGLANVVSTGADIHLVGRVGDTDGRLERDRPGQVPRTQPVSSSTSRPAASTAFSSFSTMPTGTSQPQLSSTKRCRFSIKRCVSDSSRITATATRCMRTTWCSNRSPSGASTSTSSRSIHRLL